MAVYISQRSNAGIPAEILSSVSLKSMLDEIFPLAFLFFRKNKKKKEGLVDTIPSPDVYEIKWHAKAFHRWLDVGVKSLKLALRSPVCDASLQPHPR